MLRLRGITTIIQRQTHNANLINRTNIFALTSSYSPAAAASSAPLHFRSLHHSTPHLRGEIDYDPIGGAGANAPEPDVLPDFEDRGSSREDDFDDGDNRQDRSDAREAAQAARQLGVGGPMSKADRAASKMKNARARKALTEEAKHSKARLEKQKEKARKAAALKAAASSEEVIEVVEEEDPLAKVANVELDARQQKALNKELAAVIPKTAPNVRKSPAQIAAEAAIAAKAKAALLAEQAIVRVNEKISASQIILIGPDGKKLGVYSRGDAFKTASNFQGQKYDLLQVSPNIPNQPATCRMLDYKLHKSQEDRRAREDARAKRLLNREMKNLTFKGKIALGDFQTKVEQIRKFLNKGHPVKLGFFCHGPPDPLLFVPQFESAVEQLLLDGAIEPGTLLPTKPYIIFAPLNDKKRATMFPKLTDEQKKKYGVTLDTKTGIWRQRGRLTEEEIDALEEEEDDEEDDQPTAKEGSPSTPATTDSAAKATPATATAAAAPPAAAAASSQSTNKKKHKKSKPTYASGPALFSKAALQNMKKEAEQAANTN